MHRQHPQTAYRRDAILIGAIIENCDKNANQIQRMQRRRSCRDRVADAGSESVRKSLYLEQHGQNCFLKPISYEKQNMKKKPLPFSGKRPSVWWSIVRGSRAFKSFAAQRYRVPVLSVKSSFPNHVHCVSERLQGNLPYRESARKKHLASGRKQPMRHTPSQRLYIPLLRDTAPYPVFPGRTRPLSM